MNSKAQPSVAGHAQAMRWFMAIAWVVIAVKCVFVWWAMMHWSVPFHPLWIVGPTLVFAALATGLWLGHRDE